MRLLLLWCNLLTFFFFLFLLVLSSSRLSGTLPFFSNNDRELRSLCAKGVYSFAAPQWDQVSDTAKDLISRMLVIDPRKRITAQEALSHDWVQIERYSSTVHLKDTLEELKATSKLRRKLRVTMISPSGNSETTQLIISEQVAFFTVRAMTSFKAMKGVDIVQQMKEGRTLHVREHGALAEQLEIKAEHIGADELGRLISMLTTADTKRGRLVGRTCDPKVRSVVSNLHPAFDISVEIMEEEEGGADGRAMKTRMMSTDSMDDDMVS